MNRRIKEIAWTALMGAGGLLFFGGLIWFFVVYYFGNIVLWFLPRDATCSMTYVPDAGISCSSKTDEFHAIAFQGLWGVAIGALLLWFAYLLKPDRFRS